MRHLVRLLRPHVLLTILIGAWAGAAQAQTASVRGLVTAADDGAALVGANVLLLTPTGERAGAVATNVDGYYQIRSLEPGRYRIRISYVGFETRLDTLSLRPGRQRYNARLSPSQQALEEVEVTVERGATQRRAGVQTIGTADLERIPTPGPSGDLAAYLQTLPGVVSMGDRGGELYIRGGTPSQNLILVDDLRVIKPFHISGLYSAFPQEIIKNAEVHAGGFSAEYMGAISSVIDVSLRKGNMQEYEGSISASSYLTSARIEGPIRKGQDSFLAVARHSLIKHTGGPLSGKDVPLSFYDLTGRYSLQAETASCNLTGMRTHDQGQINPERNLQLSWSNTAVGGRCLLFGNAVGYTVDLSGGFSQFQNQAGTPQSPQRSATLQKGYVTVESEIQLFGSTFTYGARWTLDHYQYNIDERFTFLQQNEMLGSTVRGYASVDWTLGDRLTVTPSFGTHWTNWRMTSPTYEPRLRMTYQPDGTGRQEFSLALGKYNQPANGITDERDAGTTFTVWQPAEENDPLPQAFHGILGYRQRIGSSIEVSAETYVKSLSDIPVPQWSPVARFDVETTVADGLAYGADIRAEFETDPLYLFLGYGWSKVNYEAARDNLGAWIEGEVVEYTPPHDRRHQVNMVASYKIGSFTANANWKLSSGRPYTKVSGYGLVLNIPADDPTRDPGTAATFYHRPYNARLPVYHRLDLSVERTFDLARGLALDAKVGALNSYDRQNVFYYDIQTLKRVDQTPLLPYVSLRLRVN